MVLTKKRATAKHQPIVFGAIFAMAIAIALLVSGCGSSRSSKQATYDGCEIYDYFDNRLLGEEAVEERSDWSEVRGYYKDRQVYGLHISTGYESWVEGGRPNDNVTGGCLLRVHG